MQDLILRRLFTQMVGNLGNVQQRQMEEIAGRFMYDAQAGRDAVFYHSRDEHPNGKVRKLLSSVFMILTKSYN